MDTYHVHMTFLDGSGVCGKMPSGKKERKGKERKNGFIYTYVSSPLGFRDLRPNHGLRRCISDGAVACVDDVIPTFFLSWRRWRWKKKKEREIKR